MGLSFTKRICVQKGRITALNFSGKKITDLAPFSQLTALGDLYLNNCGLSDISALRSEKLDRLELADNAISDLKTLSGCSNLRWIVLKNNQLLSTAGIELLPKLVSQDLTGNPLSN
jgi:Leucine-rich repeat (LRR) protein